MVALSAGGVVALAIVAAVLVIVVLAAIPAIRRARDERRLHKRRDEVADAHRDRAREQEARAALAEREAKRARAEAALHEQEASMHDAGLADERLDRPVGGRFRRRDERAAERAAEAERERSGRR